MLSCLHYFCCFADGTATTSQDCKVLIDSLPRIRLFHLCLFVRSDVAVVVGLPDALMSPRSIVEICAGVMGFSAFSSFRR